MQKNQENPNANASLIKSTSRIKEVLNVLSDVASQTNLLSLNASIEAARVGEHGKGFAVVAKEIRKLSDASVESADNIRNMLAEVQTEADDILQVKEAYENEKLLLDSLLNSSKELIFFKDLDLRFTRVSESLAQLFPGETSESLIGKTDYDFYPEEEAKKYNESEKKLLNGDEFEADHINTEKQSNGSIRFLLVTKFPLRGRNGEVIGIFGIARDITHLEDKMIQERQKLEGVNSEQTKVVSFD